MGYSFTPVQLLTGPELLELELDEELLEELELLDEFELLLEELLELELLVEFELLLDEELELLLEELELLVELVELDVPQEPTLVQEASLPGTVVVYQLAW